MDKMVLAPTPESMHSNNYYDISQLDKLRSAAPDDPEAFGAGTVP